MASKILDIDQIMALTGLSHRSIYTAIQKGQFPRQIQLTARRVGWLESEIDAWIDERIADRDGVAP